MRRSVLPQGSLAWLVAHETRLGLRQARSRVRARSRWAGYGLLLAYIALGVFLGWKLRHVPIDYQPVAGDVVLAIAIGLFSFMVTQAMLGSQQALYGNGDLDLLLSAPMRERTILRAKLIGIAVAIVLTYTVILLPLVLPVALLNHPALLGIVALLASLALTAACLGLALTLLLTRIAGPRAARTVGQIAAALIGGALFLVSQLWAHDDRLRGKVVMIEKIRASRLGEQGLGAIPGRAAFGDPLSVTLLLGTAIGMFILTGMLFQRWFLASYQAASMRLARPSRSRSGIARHFHRGLFGAVFAKEWHLLARDPALVFQVLLRLIYLAPLALVGFNGRHAIPIAPGLGFASVIVIGQLAGSIAWLAISAEDTPDLLVVAPVEKEQLEMAKLLAALAMAAPLGLILPIVLATQTLPGAAVTLVMTALAGLIAGLIELKLGKPMPRVAFNQRRAGGTVAGIVAGLSTLILGAVTGLAVYALG